MKKLIGMICVLFVVSIQTAQATAQTTREIVTDFRLSRVDKINVNIKVWNTDTQKWDFASDLLQAGFAHDPNTMTLDELIVFGIEVNTASLLSRNNLGRQYRAMVSLRGTWNDNDFFKFARNRDTYFQLQEDEFGNVYVPEEAFHVDIGVYTDVTWIYLPQELEAELFFFPHPEYPFFHGTTQNRGVKRSDKLPNHVGIPSSMLDATEGEIILYHPSNPSERQVIDIVNDIESLLALDPAWERYQQSLTSTTNAQLSVKPIGGSEVEVTVSSSEAFAGRTVTLQCTSDIAYTAWQDVADLTLGHHGEASFVDRPAERGLAACFWRVVLLRE